MSFFEKTATQLGAMLRDGQCSSEEIVQEHLSRIDAVDNTIEAFLTVTREQALENARASDKRRKEGKTLHELDGVPIGIKDNICTKGVATTCASRMLEDFVPPYSATVMDRLEKAGLITLGKLNMDEFAMGSSCETSYFKQTKNPRGLDRVPGGSSGGSAAAVAAGEVPFALGSDTGGSIRMPAAYCGVVGLKPTYGTVSRYGVVAFGSSLDQVAPIGRSIEDVAALYGILAGYDDMDAVSVRREYPNFCSSLSDGVKGRKIGIPKEYFGEGVGEEVKMAVMSAAKELERMGATLKEVSLPSTDYALSAYYIISSAEASSNLSRYDGVRFGYRATQYSDVNDMIEKSRSEGFGDEVQRRILLGTNVLSSGYYDAYYKRALLLRQKIREEFADVFQQCDLLVTPTAPGTAFRLGENAGDPLKMYACDVCTVPASIAGITALSIPCGSGGDGMPIGMQMIGPAFSEAALLASAYTYEQAVGGWNSVPVLA